MQMKLKTRLIILLSAIAAALIITCAFMFTSKTTARAAEAHDHSTMTELSGIAGVGIIGGEWYLSENTNGDITIEEDSEVTICLNGHTLTGSGTGSVITVKEGAKLTLCDCQGTGIVTGGTGNGVGIMVYGGGVYVSKNSSFIMTGGKISDNTAAYGAGVYVAENSTFTMTGGTISNNTAEGYGGGVHVTSSIFIMTRGTIEGNTAKSGGTGVYVNQSGTFRMSGGTIEGNTASAGYGGGVFVEGYEYGGTFEISGAPVITGNQKAGSNDNVYWGNFWGVNPIITVTGELTEGAQIGVYNTGAVATGFTQGDKASKYFIPDNPENCAYVSDETSGAVTIVEQHDIITHEAQQATCTENGWQAYESCSRCDYSTDKVEISALGHKYGEWTVTREATESEEGEERRVCENDNTHYETRTIPKLTPTTPTPTPAEENKSYVWICWLLIPSAIAAGGVTLGILVYKKKL